MAEKCPVCGSEVLGKKLTGVWLCSDCGHQWEDEYEEDEEEEEEEDDADQS